MFDKRKIKRTARLVQSYRAVFESNDGQAVLSDLAGKCGMTGYYPAPKQSATDWAFWEGKRAAVLDICRMLEYDDAKLTDLLRKEIDNGK